MKNGPMGAAVSLVGADIARRISAATDNYIDRIAFILFLVAFVPLVSESGWTVVAAIVRALSGPVNFFMASPLAAWIQRRAGVLPTCD